MPRCAAGQVETTWWCRLFGHRMTWTRRPTGGASIHVRGVCGRAGCGWFEARVERVALVHGRPHDARMADDHR